MVEENDGDRLSALMRRAGISDQQLADAVHASTQAVGKWKRTGDIARSRIAPICRVLSASADELLGLVALNQINETAGPYRAALDRETLRRAVHIVESELSRPNMLVLDSDGRAELIVTIYDRLQLATTEHDVQGFLSRILNAFANREDNRDHGGRPHGAHRS